MNTEALWKKCVDFHGHACPGLAIGFKACQGLREHLGVTFAADEELVCVTENDACGLDAIQVLTGCTLGKGNLLRRLRGKQAYSFFVRASGARLRLVLKPLDQEMDRQARLAYLLQGEPQDLFWFKQPAFDLPEEARIFPTVVCAACGEGAAEPFVRLQGGRLLCLDCAAPYERGW